MSRTPGSLRIELPETATLPSVRALSQQFLEAFEAGGAQVVIDAGAVRRVDTAAFQTLLSACRSARELGIELTLEQASEPFADVAMRLGLDRELDLSLPSKNQGA